MAKSADVNFFKGKIFLVMEIILILGVIVVILSQISLIGLSIYSYIKVLIGKCKKK